MTKRTGLQVGVVLWLSVFAAYVDRTVISIAAPGIGADLGLSATGIGIALSAFFIGYVIGLFPGGLLADRFGVKPVLVTTLIWYGVFAFLTGLANSLVALVIIRIIFGLGEGGDITGVFKGIADITTEKTRGIGNGLIWSSNMIGAAVVVPAAAFIIQTTGDWRYAFFLTAIVPVVVAIIFLAIRFPSLSEINREEEDRSESIVTTGQALRSPNVWLLAASWFAFNFAFWGLLLWLPSYLAEQRNFTLVDSGFGSAIPYLAGAAGVVISGIVADRLSLYNKRRMAGLEWIVAVIFLYLAFISPNASGAVALLAASMFFTWGTVAPFVSYNMGWIAHEAYGSAMGVQNSIGQIGAIVAPVLIGAIVSSTRSFALAFYLMAAMLVVAGVLTLINKSAARRLTLQTGSRLVEEK